MIYTFKYNEMFLTLPKITQAGWYKKIYISHGSGIYHISFCNRCYIVIRGFPEMSSCALYMIKRLSMAFKIQIPHYSSSLRTFWLISPEVEQIMDLIWKRPWDNLYIRAWEITNEWEIIIVGIFYITTVLHQRLSKQHQTQLIAWPRGHNP